MANESSSTGGEFRELEFELHSRVGDMMTSSPVYVDERATLRFAAAIMASDGVGALLVSGASGVLRIVTERDIVAALGSGVDPDRAFVIEVASDQVAMAHEDASVADVMRMMADYSIRHVPVGKDGSIVGIVSARDVLRGLSDAEQAAF